MDPKFFSDPKYFFETKNLFDTKFVFCFKFFRPNFFWITFFSTQILLTQIFFELTICFRSKNFLDPNLFGPKNKTY